jgi:CRP-like cAMP-binding protein
MPQKNSNRLLASLKSEDFSILSRHFREVPLVQGQFLLERGERVDAVHFPQSGMISLVVEMPEDRTVEVAMVGSEGAVGLAVGLGSRISSITALVQCSGTSLCISASRFRGAVAQSQHLRELIVRHTELQMGQIEQTAACNALHDVPARLSRWLLQTSDKIGGDTIPFTREFLGKMLGVQRGTIAVTAAKFEAEGLIHTRRGRIELLNKKALRKHACACYDYIQRHIDRLVPKVSSEN